MHVAFVLFVFILLICIMCTIGGLSNREYVRDLYGKADSDTDDDETDATLTVPTATERVLPWKRDPQQAESLCIAPTKQREFPPWLKNEDYMVHGTAPENILADVKHRAVLERADSVESEAEFAAAALAARRGSRRHSEAEFQERPPMNFDHHKRRMMKSQASRTSILGKAVNEEDEVSRF